MKQTCASAHEFDNRPAPGPAFTDIVALRDYLNVHLSKLSEVQRAALIAWSQGVPVHIIAHRAGVTERAARKQIQTALRRLRELAGE